MTHHFSAYLPDTIAIADYLGPDDAFSTAQITDILAHGYTGELNAWELDIQNIILDDLYDTLCDKCSEHAELTIDGMGWDCTQAAEYLYNHIDREPLEYIAHLSSPVTVYTPCTKAMLGNYPDLYDLAHDLIPTTAPNDYTLFFVSIVNNLYDYITVDNTDERVFTLTKPTLVARHRRADSEDLITHSTVYAGTITAPVLYACDDNNGVAHHAHGTASRTQ